MASLSASAGNQAAAPAAGRVRMTWVTWRQHRIALAGVAVLLGAWAVLLGVTGLRMHGAYAALLRSGCQAVGALYSSHCGQLASAAYHAGYPLTGNVPLVTIGLWALPALIGTFAGAPVVAREVEAGTFRFAWTQAVGRTRWLLSRLVVLAAALTAAAAAFGALAGWWLGQADTAPAVGSSPWQSGQFGLTAITFAGWTVLAFALGVCAGALIGRTVPAMAATAACTAAAAGLAYWKLTGLLTGMSPVIRRTILLTGANNFTSSNTVPVLAGGSVAATPARSWALRVWFTGPHGQAVLPYSPALNGLWNLKASAQPAWLAGHHYTLWVAYQPASRFWVFQCAEGGACALLALLLGAATVWLARHRTA